MTKRPTARFYLNVQRGIYWTIPYSIGRATVPDIPLSITALKRAKPGYPWSCWLAEAIKTYAEENPRAFPHPVEYVYVTKSVVYIVDRLRGIPSHCIRYSHDQRRIPDRFDSPRSRKRFIREINGTRDALMLTVLPGHKRRIGETNAGGNGNGGGGSRSIRTSKGALRRAELAGLMPPRTGRLTSRQLFM